MNAKGRLIVILGSLHAVCAVAARLPAHESNINTVDFLRDIQPIFTSRCLKCHGGDKSEGGLRLTTLASAMKATESGARAIVPNKTDKSELLRRITAAEADERMPPVGPRLTDRQTTLLKSWIAEGAEWPTHWAYDRLVRPRPPDVATEHRQWVRSQIDAFVLDGLLRRKLKPSPAASRRTLLRRVYFDLIGMPPTAKEVDGFLANSSPSAYEHVVDRLLASPRYGERWARHWMDVVHYAETHGHDQDRPREHAWPYRDYLIRSFNEDKPYGRFVQEQIAGDALFPDDPQAIVATGMLATGPWDESSLRDIREDSLDRQVGRYLDRDDIVTTVMSTFVSSTVHCARCHNHKFDPISQRDYYGLQAVFAATDKANRMFDPAPVARRRRELTDALAKLPARIKRADPTLLSAELAERIARWEENIAGAAETWKAVELIEFHSAEGSTLRKLDDGSLLSGGPRPEKDTYTIVARAAQRSVTGLRIEVLTDKSLPKSGPGRQDNGNLHLSEIHVWQMPNKPGGKPRRLTLKAAVADFNQRGWSIDRAIDGNPATAWGIFPEVGKPHQAQFALAEAATGDEPVTLKIELRQVHGGGHLIGRPRLSTSDGDRPLMLDAKTIAPQIADIVRVSLAERTDKQKIELAAAFLKQTLAAELAELPPPQMVYCGTNRFKADGSFRPSASPRTVHVLKRGNVTTPLGEAQPAALECLPQLPGRLKMANLKDEGQRRVALARWMTDPRNGLTWRSIANRVWHYHFGRGIVDTPNDFGRMGSAPTHPKLLDWMAAGLRDGNGSLKRLHRQIVTSAVYRQSSQQNPEFVAIDSDNRYLWRMNRRRLDAESLRDAVLRISGRLDTTMGGPSVRQFNQFEGVHVTPKVDYINFDVNHAGNYRRSVYRFVFRTLPDPFMEALDCPDGSQLTPKRNTSLTALQSLAMLNDKLIVRQSEHIAERAIRAAESGKGKAAPIERQVDEVFRLIFSRKPTKREKHAVAGYAARHGLANACRFLLNSNEFMFVD